MFLEVREGVEGRRRRKAREESLIFQSVLSWVWGCGGRGSNIPTFFTRVVPGPRSGVSFYYILGVTGHGTRSDGDDPGRRRLPG